jgi:hypothetical protein
MSVFNLDTEFDGFSLRRLFRKGEGLANRASLGLYGKAKGIGENTFRRGEGFANRAGFGLYGKGKRKLFGFDDFEGFSEDFDGSDDDGTEHFLKKVFKRKPGGTFMGNLLRGVAQNAKGMIPGGNLLPIGDGLMMKKPEIQAAPAEAIQMAQTPAQATQVIQALAPNLPPAAVPTATQAVMSANDPGEAIRVATSLNAMQNNGSKKKNTAMIIGGSIFSVALIALIIWLIFRK